jgi:hypothetical protein
MKVQLDVFSGLPNPCWELTSAQTAEFRVLFGSLSEIASLKHPPDKLGYRGMIAVELENLIPGYNDIVAYSGMVWARRGGEILRFSDKGRVLEGWLFQTGKPWIDPELYHELRAEAGLEDSSM